MEPNNSQVFRLLYPPAGGEDCLVKGRGQGTVPCFVGVDGKVQLDILFFV